MTIEEKAKEYRSDTFGTPFGNDIEMAFSEGAQWMLEKACGYIRSQYPVHYQEWYELAEEHVKQFKKAMEE
jgi:hypothetical protein